MEMVPLLFLIVWKMILIYKLSQLEYNARLLYFIKSQLGIGRINKETKLKQ